MVINIVMVEPEIPQNTGNVARTCAATGARLHLVGPMGFTIDDKKLKRAGLDYWEYLDITLHDSFEDYLSIRKPSALRFLSTKGGKTLYDTTYPEGCALIFGCESAGLPKDYYLRYAKDLVTIPMPGEHGRSLNLSNAVAVAAYEAYRTQLKIN
jgi:tRNA (cytidine/uridine-2'-O-)-methyltransferase